MSPIRAHKKTHAGPLATRPEHDASAALSVHDLTVAYERKPVLWNVDCDVPAGTLTAIVGPNGAGKSTLIKACLGLTPAGSGRVEAFGQPIARARKRIGYVPQRESVDWQFPVSVLEVAAMGCYGRLGWLRPVTRSARKKAAECLDRVGLSRYASRQIGQLSGGQQQRVFLARALAQDADLYLMDEPFAGVDAATERAILEVLRELRDKGRTVVCVHHSLQTVKDYFDRVILLNVRVVAEGPVGDVFTTENLTKTYGGRLTLLERAGAALAQGGAV